MTYVNSMAATALGLSLTIAGSALAQSDAPVIDMEATGTTEMQQEAKTADGMETDTSADMQTAATRSGETGDRPGENSGVVDGQSMADLIRGSELEDAEVYVASAGLDDWASTEIFAEIGANWSEIGEVEDLAISPDRTLVGFVVETNGGLLDLGDQSVLLHLADVKLVRSGEDEFHLVTRLSESQLDDMKEVTETWY